MMINCIITSLSIILCITAWETIKTKISRTSTLFNNSNPAWWCFLEPCCFSATSLQISALTSTFLPISLVLIWWSGCISWINRISSILIVPALFRISRSLREHHSFGVKAYSNGVDRIIQSMLLRVGSKEQPLWWAFVRAPDNRLVMSFLRCLVYAFSLGLEM